MPEEPEALETTLMALCQLYGLVLLVELGPAGPAYALIPPAD